VGGAEQKRAQISSIAPEAVCDTARGAIGGKQKKSNKMRLLLFGKAAFFPYNNPTAVNVVCLLLGKGQKSLDAILFLRSAPFLEACLSFF